jgi:hypothetical protein
MPGLPLSESVSLGVILSKISNTCFRMDGVQYMYCKPVNNFGISSLERAENVIFEISVYPSII